MRTLWIALLLTSCSRWDDDEPFSDCDPLQASLCALPFPSSFYEKDDPDTVSGRRIDLRPTSLPVNRDDVQLNPTYWNEKDGWSINSPMLVYFDDVSLDGTIDHAHLDDYTSADALTVIVDVDTGERVPHFVELDATAPSPSQSLLILRPVVPFDFEHHYVVGIRGLSTNAGTPIAPSQAFRELRDGDRTESWDVEGRRDLYEDTVFPTLEAAGMPRDELILAWDFHTMSRFSAVGRAEWVRDDVLERVGTTGPAYTITRHDDGDCTGGGHIARTIEGTMTVPLYTTEDKPATFLTRDADGMPFYNGDTTAEFVVRVPCSVADAAVPAPVLQYGHGLLGSHDEAKTGWLADFADTNGYVIVAVDWKGMAEYDVGDIILMSATDPSNFAFIPERSVQGLAEQFAVLRMITGAFKDDDLMKFDGQVVVDPSKRYFFGNSQGSIMGTSYLALSPDIERAVLGVGGMPYSLLLPRSNDFTPYFLVFQQKFSDHRDTMLLILGLTQQVWDLSEPGGYAHDFTDPPEGMPAKTALLQVAIGDAQVTTLGAHVQARVFGAKTVATQTRPVFGIEEAQPGFSGSAFVEYSFSDVDPEPFDSTPPNPHTDPHECPRRDPRAQQQAAIFLETGVVENFCDGPCTDTLAGCGP